MNQTHRELAEELGFSVAGLNEIIVQRGLSPIVDANLPVTDSRGAAIREALGNPLPPIPRNLWLTGLSVGGFKAFNREQSAPLGRITLVFGPNSGGKSSLLHALLFAQEAATSGELDVYAPKLAEGSIDLGGFHQFTHCQRTAERPITLEFAVRPNELNEFFAEKLGEEFPHRARKVTVSVVLGVVPAHFDNDQEHGKPALARIDLGLDGRAVCQVGRTGEGKLRFRTLDLDHPFFTGLAENFEAVLRPQTAEPRQAARRVRALFEDVFPRTILAFDRGPLPSGSVLEEKNDDEPDSSGLRQKQSPDGEDEYLFFADDPDSDQIALLMQQFASLLGEFVCTAFKPVIANLDAMTYLGPLRSFPERDFSLTHARDSHWHAGGGFAWDVIAKDPFVREQVNRWFTSPFLQTPYEFVVTDLVSGQIVGSAIESEFSDILHEKAREHEEKRGSKRPEDDEAFYFPYYAWDTDTLGRRLVEKALQRATPSRRTELRLIDKRTGAVVSHRDVGVGLSQILPVLVRALPGSEVERLHLIEQPEIHVHPALQAELGDVLIASALGNQQNRFLIETHSEHLLLRLLKRIRQTAAGETEKGRRPVYPEDVVVIYAEPTKEGTKLHHLRITPDGEFADRWPQGFFTERGAELFT